MSHEEKWKILADLLTELQKQGKKIPTDVMKDLRSAKTMIQVLKADPTHIETMSRIDTYLRSVESYAISTAERLEKKIAEDWLTKLNNQNRGKTSEKTEVASRFIHGIPRDKNWVRIQISEDITQENLKKLVKENGLSYLTQKNGYITVYGNGENLKKFVKMLTDQLRGARNV